MKALSSLSSFLLIYSNNSALSSLSAQLLQQKTWNKILVLLLKRLMAIQVDSIFNFLGVLLLQNKLAHINWSNTTDKTALHSNSMKLFLYHFLSPN